MFDLSWYMYKKKLDVLQLLNQVDHKCDLHVGLINTKFRLLQVRLFAKNCVYCEMAMVKTSARHTTVVNASFQRNPYLTCPYNTCGDCINRKKSRVCGICNTDHKNGHPCFYLYEEKICVDWFLTLKNTPPLPKKKKKRKKKKLISICTILFGIRRAYYDTRSRKK